MVLSWTEFCPREALPPLLMKPAVGLVMVWICSAHSTRWKLHGAGHLLGQFKKSVLDHISPGWIRRWPLWWQIETSRVRMKCVFLLLWQWVWTLHNNGKQTKQKKEKKRERKKKGIQTEVFAIYVWPSVSQPLLPLCGFVKSILSTNKNWNVFKLWCACNVILAHRWKIWGYTCNTHNMHVFMCTGAKHHVARFWEFCNICVSLTDNL